MAQDNSISQDLYDLLTTANFDPEVADENGQTTQPGDATVFSFDWISDSGKNYGTAVAVITDDNDLQFFFGDNLGKGMEEPDKSEWYSFLEQLSNFATKHRYTWSPKNLNQLKRTMAGMAAIKEGLFEGYYGTRKKSYMGEETQARLVINHNRIIGENDKRYRYVESLFIETVDGERFKLPFKNLSGGKAMLEHVRQGGRPYDVRGVHIAEMVTEMSVLARFNRARQGRVFEGVTQELVEQAEHYYRTIQENLKHMASSRGYTRYFESWTPADVSAEEALVEDLKTLFIEQTLDTRIEAALPTLVKIQQRETKMKEAEIFESWVERLAEGTWALPDNPEAQTKLNELMSKELIVGPDATNATQQLYDVIGDDQLFDILQDLADRDPRANVWDDTDVQSRLAELGIQMNTTPQADEQPPVAPAAGTEAPVPPEQGVAEGYLGNPGEEDSPVAQAITRRILMQRTDLLAKYGPELVLRAIENVADYVGDVDEIGSSDVSAYVKQVERMLSENPPEAFSEGDNLATFVEDDQEAFVNKHQEDPINYNAAITGSYYESALNPNDPKGDYHAKRKAIQDIQMDPNTQKDPQLKAELARRKADLEKEAQSKGIKEGADILARIKSLAFAK